MNGHDENASQQPAQPLPTADVLPTRRTMRPANSVFSEQTCSAVFPMETGEALNNPQPSAVLPTRRAPVNSVFSEQTYSATFLVAAGEESNNPQPATALPAHFGRAAVNSVFSEQTYPPESSTPLAQLAGEKAGDAVDGAPAVIPVEMAPPSLCERCGEAVAGDFKSRRAHIYEKHRPEKKVTLLETQEVLRESIKECFPNAVVQNDLMCNFHKCGQEVTHYKGSVVWELQRYHVQQHHLASIDPDLVPLHCPVGGCKGWGSVRRDNYSLKLHLRNVHKGRESMSDVDKTACKELLDRLQAATEQSLATFFPHTPKGLLCIADANKKSRPKAARFDIVLRPPQPRPLTSAMPLTGSGGETVVPTEPPATDCQQCGEVVPAAYINRREHVVARHMGGRLEGQTEMHRQDTLKMEMLRSFPDARVCNDLTCNRCGEELKPKAGRLTRELRSHHIQQCHFDAVGDDAKIKCPVSDCQRTLYQIPHISALQKHLAKYQGVVGKLTAAEKETYERLRERVREATDELLPGCFPHTPKGFLDERTRRKRPAPSDDEPLVNPY